MITIDRSININEARAAGPYFVRHEGEAGGGFYDIALEPRLLDWPDIAHAAIIELKYLKPGEPEPTPAALAAIKAEAIDQLDRYSADPALVAKWRLKPVESPTANLSTFQPFNRRSRRLRLPPPPRPRLQGRRLPLGGGGVIRGGASSYVWIEIWMEATNRSSISNRRLPNRTNGRLMR